MKTTRKLSESGHESGEVKSRRKVGCFILYFIPANVSCKSFHSFSMVSEFMFNIRWICSNQCIQCSSSLNQHSVQSSEHIKRHKVQLAWKWPLTIWKYVWQFAVTNERSQNNSYLEYNSRCMLGRRFFSQHCNSVARQETLKLLLG